ncbi:hypothetical protein J437_LFUL019615, partial [Ladona fulva]
MSVMSASNGEISETESETFFTKVQKPFPKLGPDGKIETLKFLESAKGVAVLAEAGNVSEDMRPILRKAYEETLEPYHLWVSKLLFKANIEHYAICQMCPSRKDVVLTLTLGKEDQEKIALLHLSSFLVDLKANIQAIYDLTKTDEMMIE